jgi:hypothetical protein
MGFGGGVILAQHEQTDPHASGQFPVAGTAGTETVSGGSDAVLVGGREKRHAHLSPIPSSLSVAFGIRQLFVNPC